MARRRPGARALARTPRARSLGGVGVLVSCNAFGRPGLLVKEAVTVDQNSDGRRELGVGAGWYVPQHEKFGVELPPPAELVARFREAVEIIDHMLRNEFTSY